MRSLLFLALLLPGCATAQPAEPAKRVALSFDDVPRHAGAWFTPDERTDRLIEELAKVGVEQAAFFVTPGNLEKSGGAGGEARIERYVAAGHVIANHSWSHRWLRHTDTETYIADIDKAADWLEGRDGYRPWYRYPYLDHGRGDMVKRNVVAEALDARGLTDGHVTIDNYDWALDGLANKAKRAGRDVDLPALCALYAETLVQASEFSDAMARESMGRSPAHVLLLHETDIAANCLGTLARAYDEAGWRFITADEAYRDPLFGEHIDSPFMGGGHVAAHAHAAGRAPRDLIHERTDEKVLEQLFEERVMKNGD